MGCLATGCSWTNSIPPNELTVMCLNRGREQEAGGGGLSTERGRGEGRTTKTWRAKLKRTNKRTRQELFTDGKEEGSNLAQETRHKYLNIYLRIEYSVKADGGQTVDRRHH